MKTVLLAISGLLVIGLITLYVLGQTVQEVRTEVEISAPPSQVWKVLVDIDGWQQWSPIIQKASGKAELGSSLSMTMIGKTEGEAGPSYNPRIITMEPPNHFRWTAHMMAGFIMTNDKVFELEATATGTKLVHRELFKGLLAPIFCLNMVEGVTPMLNSMNDALKARVEQ